MLILQVIFKIEQIKFWNEPNSSKWGVLKLFSIVDGFSNLFLKNFLVLHHCYNSVIFQNHNIKYINKRGFERV